MALSLGPGEWKVCRSRDDGHAEFLIGALVGDILGRSLLKSVSPAPCAYPWNPARHVSAIFFIVSAKHFPERRLLIKFHKQNNGNRGNKHHQKCNAVRSAEHNPQAHPAREESHIHRVSRVPVKSDHHQPAPFVPPQRGVPRPVRPKSQMHLRATEKPSTDGTTPIHLHRAAPTAATPNPNQPGSSQNHNAKYAAPTPNEATVVSRCMSFDSTTGLAAMTFS